MFVLVGGYGPEFTHRSPLLQGWVFVHDRGLGLEFVQPALEVFFSLGLEELLTEFLLDLGEGFCSLGAAFEEVEDEGAPRDGYRSAQGRRSETFDGRSDDLVEVGEGNVAEAAVSYCG